MTEMNMNHLLHVDRVAKSDAEQVKRREQTYRGSWKKRGGIGAFMMLARKWDRIENMLENPKMHDYGGVARTAEKYDIFGEIVAQPDGSDGSMLAEVRDLRQYLLLVESEMISRKIVTIQNDVEPKPKPKHDGNLTISFHLEPSTPGTPEDGGHHARAMQHHEFMGGDATGNDDAA